MHYTYTTLLKLFYAISFFLWEIESSYILNTYWGKYRFGVILYKMLGDQLISLIASIDSCVVN